MKRDNIHIIYYLHLFTYFSTKGNCMQYDMINMSNNSPGDNN